MRVVTLQGSQSQSFAFRYDGNIVGRNNLSLQLLGGSSFFTAHHEVYDANIEGTGSDYDARTFQIFVRAGLQGSRQRPFLGRALCQSRLCSEQNGRFLARRDGAERPLKFAPTQWKRLSPPSASPPLTAFSLGT